MIITTEIKIGNFRLTQMAPLLLIEYLIPSLLNAFQYDNLFLLTQVPTIVEEIDIFQENPSSNVFTKTYAGVLLNRIQKDNEFIETNNNGENTLKTSAKTDIVGFGFASGLGPGASFSLIATKSFQENKSESSPNIQVKKEFFYNQLIKGNFSVELSPDLTAGIGFTYLRERADLFGQIFNNTLTTFEGTMTGISAGLAFKGQQFKLQGMYQQPLVGKATILGEDKRISEPGNVNIQGVFMNSNDYSFGIDVNQILYKKDDRREGTTTNDANQTQISLEGIDIDRFIFPMETRGIGMKFPFIKSLHGHLYIYESTYKIWTDTGELPGKEEDNNTRKNYWLKFATHIEHNQLNVTLGMNYDLKNWDIDNSALAQEGSYTSKQTYLFSQISMSL